MMQRFTNFIFLLGTLALLPTFVGCQKDISVDTYVSIVDQTGKPIPARYLTGGVMSLTMEWEAKNKKYRKEKEKNEEKGYWSSCRKSLYNSQCQYFLTKSIMEVNLAPNEVYKNSYILLEDDFNHKMNYVSKKFSDYRTELYLPALGVHVEGTSSLKLTGEYLDKLDFDFEHDEHPQGLVLHEEKARSLVAEAKIVFVVDLPELQMSESRKAKGPSSENTVEQSSSEGASPEL